MESNIIVTTVSEYQLNKKQVLNVHKDSQHYGIKYHCNECDYYQANTKASLKVHTASQQKGLMRDCDQCDYKVSLKHALKVKIMPRMGLAFGFGAL